MTKAADPLPATAPDPDQLRVMRFRDRHAALGHAVTQLMGKPGFARLPFGSWSRVLVGQINRDQYFFVARGGRLVGFAGWAFAAQADAERWRAGDPLAEMDPAGPQGGDCMIINAWQADDAAANGFVLTQMRVVGRHVQAIYARRSYPDGRLRIMRLPVDRTIIAGHVARQDAARGGGTAGPAS